MRKTLSFIFALFCACFLSAQTAVLPPLPVGAETEPPAVSRAFYDLEIPVCPGTFGEAEDHHIYRYFGFTLCYRESYEQPEWAAYVLTPEQVPGQVKRTDNFRADPGIETGSALPDDYKGAGYDRGHLVPAADMSYSADSMRESFFMSNMSPQAPSFNRGIWNSLEALVRDRAGGTDVLYVVSGPILEKDDYPVIGASAVAVPEFFYKVILWYDRDTLYASDTASASETAYAAAFIIPNAKADKPLSAYLVSVDDVEARTGIDFFSLLPDPIEDAAEHSAQGWSLFPSLMPAPELPPPSSVPPEGRTVCPLDRTISDDPYPG